VTTPTRDAGPGSEPDHPRRRLGRRRRRTGPFASGYLDVGPGPLTMHESRPEGPVMFRPRKRYIEVGTVFAALVALGTIALVAVLVYRATRVHVDATGISDGAAITTFDAAALEVHLEFESEEEAADATLTVDGQKVEEPAVLGPLMVWRPPAPLAEGDHSIEVAVPRAAFGDSIHTWDFTVDGTAPSLTVPPTVDPVAIDDPARITGTVESGADLTADGEPVDVDDDGGFTLRYERPPAGPVTLEAADRAGNRTTASVVVPVTYPGLRGVHVTAAAWSEEPLRAGVLALIDQGRIDTVELDLKDEEGVVGYDSEVARAHEIGAVVRHYDLDAAVAAIESRGARVVGRIVAFQDPILAQAAWGAGQTSQVVQDVDGGPYDTGGGAFTNPADAAVRRYNLDLAIEAVNRGVDDILWDATRLPTGEPDTIVVPGLAGSASDAVAGFLAESHAALRSRGAYQGVTTVGEAADKGDPLGQDVARIARNADYVAPEVYPGYWGSDRHGVADPPHQPAEFTAALLTRYQQAMAGSGAVLVPWLQDFELRGVDYDDAVVRSMVDAARSVGVDRFLLWSPRVQYSAGLLDAAPPQAAAPSG
jgi:hypothetical protein